MNDEPPGHPQFRARVVAVHRDRWEVTTEAGTQTGAGTPMTAVLSGRFRHDATEAADAPVVGDWVRATQDRQGDVIRIVGVEPRSGLLARKRPGDAERDAVVEQAIAANIDLALLAMAVDEDFSIRRLERYLTLAWDSGASPVVVLTKSDLAGTGSVPGVEARVAQASEVAFGVQVIATSAVTGQGVDELRSLLQPGTCAILLGSSGVGKSSLLNTLAGTDLQAVYAVRDSDGKGRHTTTSRRLVELPWGAYLVDTPGLRELQLWGDEDSLAGSFPDVADLARRCRFTDCVHEEEPGCAVLAAVAGGELPQDRLDSWRRLRRELAYLQRRTDGAAARAERQKWKVIAKRQRALKRERGR